MWKLHDLVSEKTSQFSILQFTQLTDFVGGPMSFVWHQL